MSRPTTFVNPPDHPSPPFYTHVAVTSFPPTASGKPTKLITLAGQIGRDNQGHSPPDLPSQVRIALQNVSLCLHEVGANTRDVISIRQYVVGLSPAEKKRKQLVLDWLECKGSFADSVSSPGFGEKDGEPPNTVLGVTALAVEGVLYEVEVVAAISSTN